MDIVNEGTAFTIDVTFAAIPTSATYHIYDYETEATLVSETSITPALSVTIPITSTAAAITDSRKDINRRVVVVSSVYNNDAAQSKIDTYEFWVRNVASVS